MILNLNIFLFQMKLIVIALCITFASAAVKPVFEKTDDELVEVPDSVAVANADDASTGL